jgi:hypothetical protein
LPITGEREKSRQALLEVELGLARGGRPREDLQELELAPGRKRGLCRRDPGVVKARDRTKISGRDGDVSAGGARLTNFKTAGNS